MAIAVCALAAGCAPAIPSSTDTLKIGAYSVVKEAFHDGLLPAFTAEWKRRTGRDVKFEESYNASGAQARSIAAGFDADIAILSHSGDMQVLVDAGRVAPEWDAGSEKGIMSRSLVVIGHRPGNPKRIKDWEDLARDGVGVLYPDPKTSGGARWNINAIYGAALLRAKETRPAENALEPVRHLLARIQANVVNMDPSGRQSVANFERGTGDAIVTYENELILRKRAGQAIPYVVPPSTLWIESPIAIVESSVARHGNVEVAKAFLSFVHSADGQRILEEFGFRRAGRNTEIQENDARPPLPAALFTMADLGGWETVQKAVYGPNGLWTSIFTTHVKGR